MSSKVRVSKFDSGIRFAAWSFHCIDLKEYTLSLKKKPLLAGVISYRTQVNVVVVVEAKHELNLQQRKPDLKISILS